MNSFKDLINVASPDATLVHKEGLTMATLGNNEFANAVVPLISGGAMRLALLYATDERKDRRGFGVHAVLTDDKPGEPWLVLSTFVDETKPTYPSIAAHSMSAYWYERHLHDMFGIVPIGHPDLRRLVHHENIPKDTFPLRKDFCWNTKLPIANEPHPMLHVEGEGVFEVPVGPIHAGIIEPGHFRFSVAGERIITLEGKLFFTHKGVEKLLEGKTPNEALPLIERISGDMSASHALAYVQAVESAVGSVAPDMATEATRALLCELERITMHIHDIANIGGMGTGFALVSSRGFEIKERMMQLSDLVCGNRFWRGMIVPNGVRGAIPPDTLSHIVKVTTKAVSDLQSVADIALSSEAFKERLDTTGMLSRDAALEYGALGLAARASGVHNDARVHHPYGAYNIVPAHIQIRTKGDIMARFLLRIDEMRESLRLVEEFAVRAVGALHKKPLDATAQNSTSFGIGVAESWRGEILVALTLSDGKIERCVVRDPSFCNWNLFGELAPGNIIPDFPLCNKSLNLSYSGTDM